jgi:DNA invertase Pin-like site-specific DNA recombinase
VKPAVGYLRRSTDRQEQSLGDQQTAIERHAQEHGFEILRFYKDDAISGTSTNGRKAFLQLLEDAQSDDRDFRYIVCYDVKRFSRGDIDEAGYYRHLLRQQGVDVIYAAEGFQGNSTDALVLSVKQWLGQEEVRDLSKVTIRGLLSLSEGGWWMGGLPPYGYDLFYHDATGKPYQKVRFMPNGEKQVYSVEGALIRILPPGQRLSTAKSDRARLIPSAANRVQTVRQIFEMYADLGMGLRAIASKLNEDGIPSPGCANRKVNQDNTWGLATVRAILTNSVYTGDMTWNKRSQGKFHRIANGQATKRETLGRQVQRNAQQNWITFPNAHDALVPRDLFRRAQSRRTEEKSSKENFRRGRGKNSPFLLTSLLVCKHCGFKLQGFTGHTGYRRASDGAESLSFSYVCGGYRTKGKSTCRRYWLRRDPFESFILERVEKRLRKLLKRGGEQTLRRFIAEEILAKTPDPAEETAKLRGELATIQAEADRLLDIATPANRDFVDERLGKIRARRQDLEARLADLERVDYQPVDVEAATADALANLAKFREVLQEGTLEQRKEFLRGFVAEIGIDPDKARGTITFYELPVLSLMGMPGARVHPLQIPRSKRLDDFGLPNEAWRGAA